MKQPEVTSTLGVYWGDRVRARRLEMGLTQTQFADVCDVEQQTISKIELGQMIPHDKLKLKIAQRTGSDVAALFAWPDAQVRLGGAA